MAAAISLNGCYPYGEAPDRSTRDGPVYSVSFEPASPQGARVKLRLPSSGEPLHLFSRAPAMQLEPQVEDVQCDGTLVERMETGWRLPAGCETVSWRIAFETAKQGAVRPSRQRSLIIDGAWALVSGPTSLLRVSGFEDKTLPVTISARSRP